VERIVILQEKYHAASIMLLLISCLFKDILSNAGKMGLSYTQSVLNYYQSIICYDFFLLQMILKAELRPFTVTSYQHNTPALSRNIKMYC